VSYGSLEEALTFGSELERQFICPAHDDHNASASVNSVSGLWCCYACGAAGRADLDTIEISATGVVKMTAKLFDQLTTENKFTESWLNVFDSTGPGDYWLSRFDVTTCHHFRLGSAPGVATYPLRDNEGQVLGVVTRDLTGRRKEKYRYPARVNVSNYLIDYHRVSGDDLILVEGMSDVCAVHEAGFAAVGSYRAGISSAQALLLRKYQPRTLWVAYDQDRAGDEGYSKVLAKLDWAFHVKRLWWSDYKDLAEIPVDLRRQMLAEVTNKPALVALS
jgi:hypothetical protein